MLIKLINFCQWRCLHFGYAKYFSSQCFDKHQARLSIENDSRQYLDQFFLLGTHFLFYLFTSNAINLQTLATVSSNIYGSVYQVEFFTLLLLGAPNHALVLCQLLSTLITLSLHLGRPYMQRTTNPYEALEPTGRRVINVDKVHELSVVLLDWRRTLLADAN